MLLDRHLLIRIQMCQLLTLQSLGLIAPIHKVWFACSINLDHGCSWLPQYGLIVFLEEVDRHCRLPVTGEFRHSPEQQEQPDDRHR